MVVADDVIRLAQTLPRTERAFVRDQVKFRVRSSVWLAISPDESLLGFAFPKEERADLIASRPDTFVIPAPSDERYNWVRVRLAAIDEDEMEELIFDAWRMVVPKKVAAAWFAEFDM